MQKGKLYLIPVTLGNDNLRQTLPEPVFEVVNNIDYYIVENIKSAAGFLKAAGIKKRLKELTFNVLNVDTKEGEITGFLEPAEDGQNIGLLSEAGVPCVADPGSLIVSLAHEKGIQVIPLTGPSSIILALMASGMNGQNFAFNGYLPIDVNERKNKLKELERKIKVDNQTQIFIEAPHRNDKLLEVLIENCGDNLKLCVAKNLTMDNELIVSKKISQWKNAKITLGKNPVIFLLGI
jgi:16S rRNA (cytidine1402-2'-O)-methyltransferase